jgi:iron complex outermembrane recepter protein
VRGGVAAVLKHVRMTKFYRAPIVVVASALSLLWAAMAFGQLVAPKAKSDPVVEYPTDADGRSVVVTLELTIDTDGSVKDAKEVARTPEDAEQMFVDRALAIGRTLTFSPATKDGQPIVAKIPYKVRFEAPKPATSASSSAIPSISAPTPPAPPPPPSASAPAPVSSDIHVAGDKIPPPLAASDVVIDNDILETASHQKGGGDLLNAAPGVYVGHVEGDAVANNVYLRGFNAEHGQDIEFRVGGIPVNIPSHIHGQGYADLNFIIPEVVRHLRVIEGVYDPRQGDFAVAGSAYFDLGVLPRGYRAKASAGSFGTRRLVGIWAPKDESEETFGAIALRQSDGFGPNNRGGASASGIIQYAFELPANYRLLILANAYGARSALPGALRRDDYLAGRVGFFDNYPYPTSSAMGASATRTQLGLEIDRLTENGSHLEISTYVTLTSFRLRENFTGFLQRGMEDPNKVGLGDLIEQSNYDTAFGALARYRSQRYQLLSWLSMFVEPGMTFRTSSQDQTQNLLAPPENQIWDRRIDAKIRGTDLGGYLDFAFRMFKRVRLSGGFRANALHYDIDDHLGNFTPSFEKSKHTPGFHRTAFGVAWGPRASLVIDATSWLQPMLAYGEGYRSPQARQLAEGETAPYTTVRSYEAGARAKLLDGKYVFNLAAYQTHLSDDLIFDPTEAALTRVGPTRRRGFVAYAVARPFEWLVAAVSATYVHATLQEPPPASVGDPTPAFKSGQLLPYVPPWVFRADTTVRVPIVKIGRSTLDGRVGGSLQIVAARPLPYNQYADPFGLVDLSTGIRYREVEVGLDVYNLFDRRWNDTELMYRSSWPTREIPSSLPARHFVAGSPRTILASLSVTL